MKNLLMLGLVGAFSLLSVLDAEACHRRRCGGHHHRRHHCGSVCYTPVSHSGCQVNGAYQNGAGAGVSADAGAAGAGVEAEAAAGAEAGQNR